MDRVSALLKIIEWDGSVPELSALSSSLPWDSDNDLVRLTGPHLIAPLSRFLAGETSASDVEQWANLIECREDISHDSELVKETVFVLANPSIYETLTIETARQIILKLSK